MASVASLGIASAATDNTGQSNLVDKLATTFKLNKADVQKVFDEERATHKAEREQTMKTTIEQAVKDGKLTQDQADKLTAKLQELQAERKNMKGMKEATQTERDAHKAKMDEFKQWLSDNQIPEDLVRPMGSHGRGHGHMRPEHSEQTN